MVSYAIADVAAFVAAGDPVDVEARRRGLTLYAPGPYGHRCIRRL